MILGYDVLVAILALTIALALIQLRRQWRRSHTVETWQLYGGVRRRGPKQK